MSRRKEDKRFSKNLKNKYMEEIIRLLALARAKIANLNINLDLKHEICQKIGIAELKLRGTKENNKSEITLL